jgi:hypothetical protein
VGGACSLHWGKGTLIHFCGVTATSWTEERVVDDDTSTFCFIIIFYLAISFGPECWPSSGHYSRTRQYTEIVVYRKVDVTLKAKVWTRWKWHNVGLSGKVLWTLRWTFGLHNAGFFTSWINYRLLIKHIYHQLYVLNYLLSFYQTLLATDVIFTLNSNWVRWVIYFGIYISGPCCIHARNFFLLQVN